MDLNDEQWAQLGRAAEDKLRLIYGAEMDKFITVDAYRDWSKWPDPARAFFVSCCLSKVADLTERISGRPMDPGQRARFIAWAWTEVVLPEAVREWNEAVAARGAKEDD